MLIRLVLSICFVILTFKANALKIDSIRVENLNGKNTIIHKVEAKESYYSIARKYKVSPQSIIQFNSNRTLQIGTILRVPTDRAYSIPKNEPAVLRSEIKPIAKMAIVEYKVGPKEYLLLIARKFNTTVEDLKILNNLTSNNLSVGQILKVPYGTAVEKVSAPPPVPAAA